MHHLGDHGQGTHGSRPYAWDEQKFGKILGAKIGRRGQSPMKAAFHDILRAHIMMIGHDEVRQCGLTLHAGLQARKLANDSPGTDFSE